MIFRRRDEDEFESRSLWRTLTSPFRAVVELFNSQFKRDDSLHVERSWGSRILEVVTFPVRFLAGVLVFIVQAWPQSRSGYAFLKGLPALLGVALFFGALVTADLLMTEAKRIGTTEAYLNFQVANAPDNPEYALIFAERLVEEKPDSPDYLFRLGMSENAVGNEFKALDVMSYISPNQPGGYALAHVWLANYYRAQQSTEMTEARRLKLVQQHLTHAVELTPENQAVQLSLAQMHLDAAKTLVKDSPEYVEKLNEAVIPLTEIANGSVTKIHLMVVPRLVKIHLELGNQDEARRLANKEIVVLRSNVHRNLERFDVWSTMVNCAILLKDYQLAIDIVNEGLQLVEVPGLRRQIFRLGPQVFVEKSNDFPDMSDREQYRYRLDALCEATRVNLTNRDVYLKLLDFVGTSKAPVARLDGLDNNSNRQSRLDFSVADPEWLKDLIIDSPAPGVVNVLLGMREISAGNVSKGEKQWRVAAHKFDNIQFVINNLIDVAVKERSDEINNLMDMIMLGIELFPDQPIFYHTRGTYLMKQGKYEEAIEQLVYAVEKMPQIASLHKRLITCYEAVGEDQKALEQRIKLQEQLSSLDINERKRIEESLERLDE